jgi:predicted restriction endonuclease
LQTPAQTWLGKLANLNVARTGPRGIAPHKPLMLLTVIDLIESGDIPDGWVKYDVRLVPAPRIDRAPAVRSCFQSDRC